ncbi:PREDICTED: putative cysteine-rich repeat secretory protein 25 [Camelina sativa]|uniref:Cysteine-rich repeat secretory protein 25 n=1 Tax=Camelina sativa TaxID=90675 RepID=A0ABM0W6P8_CAMSA|nr:PREDICTED: putative cysteine-rich repeat secretory protein 25 [Camelina sativa]
MMSSYSVTKPFVSVYVLAMVALQFPHSVLSLNHTNAYLNHICIKGEGTVKGNSYEEAVKGVIDHMSTYLGYGFVNGAGSDGPTKIYAKIQCRPDASESICRSCITTALPEIRRKCPNNKGRIIWYDNCLLDISSIYTLGKIDYRYIFYMYNSKDVSSNKMAFNKNTKALLYELKEKATSKKEIPYRRDYLYAAGEESLGTTKVYAMVQCTKDLSAKNCSVCLDWIMAKLPKCCNGKQGGRVLSPSCNFRYELYPFVKT